MTFTRTALANGGAHGLWVAISDRWAVRLKISFIPGRWANKAPGNKVEEHTTEYIALFIVWLHAGSHGHYHKS